jgi:hypothetical protein
MGKLPTFRTGEEVRRQSMMHAEVSEELRRRGVIRSSNNPIGDLAEHLFCRASGWKQAPSSKRDADATDAAEVRYLIKGRRLMPHNNSRQLGGAARFAGLRLWCARCGSISGGLSNSPGAEQRPRGHWR